MAKKPHLRLRLDGTVEVCHRGEWRMVGQMYGGHYFSRFSWGWGYRKLPDACL